MSVANPESLRVRGAVQGVGFRPFAYEVAHRFGLSGFARNDADGVPLEIEHAHPEVFLREEAASLAVFDAVELEIIAPRREQGFSFIESARRRAKTRIVADAATCEGWIAGAAKAQSLAEVLLVGGCMMIRVLAEGLVSALRELGPSPMLARDIPCNDRDISLGQAALACAAARGARQEKESAACV